MKKRAKKRYSGRNFARERIYVCGDYIEGALYPVFQPPGRRRRKCRESSDVQKKLNQRNAERKIIRLANANFTENDLSIGLSYDIPPADESEAKKDLQNFLRRLKRRMGKEGIELKYITCTEFGRRGGRIHHHCIISGGISRDEVERIWGKGYANARRLQFRDDGIAGLAVYMVKAHKSYRRWNCSKNLYHPEAITSDGEFTVEDLREISEETDVGAIERRYPDFIITELKTYRNPINQGFYITFSLRRRKEYERRN